MVPPQQIAGTSAPAATGPSEAELRAARTASGQFDRPGVKVPRGVTADYFFTSERELLLAVHAAREHGTEVLGGVRDLDEAVHISGALGVVAEDCAAEIDVQWPAGADVLPPERFLFDLVHDGQEWMVPRDLRFAFPDYADFSTAAACGHGHRIALARATAEFVQGCHDHDLALGQVTPTQFLFAAGYPPPVLVSPGAGLRRLGHVSPLEAASGPAADPVEDRRALGPIVLGLLADAHPEHWTLERMGTLARSRAVHRTGPTLLAHLTGRLLAGGPGAPHAGEWLDVIDEHEQE